MSGPRGVLQVGERVLLLDARDRRYLVTLQPGSHFHSHLGSVAHDDLIGRPEGIELRTSGGARLWAFRPTLADYQLKMKRGAQVVYPKDVGLILVHADIAPGAVVVEAGTGSGALTLALARAVGERGRILSYEVRDDHLARARSNIEAWYRAIGCEPHGIELRNADVFAEPPEVAADRIVLDLPEPWRGVGTTTGCLTPGGILCCYVPTVPQVVRTVEAMRSGGFGHIEVLESLVRSWNVEGPSVRPDHRMVGHTGFLIFGRKLTKEVPGPTDTAMEEPSRGG